jgi:hypothetical protein
MRGKNYWKNYYKKNKARILYNKMKRQEKKKKQFVRVVDMKRLKKTDWKQKYEELEKTYFKQSYDFSENIDAFKYTLNLFSWHLEFSKTAIIVMLIGGFLLGVMLGVLI